MLPIQVLKELLDEMCVCGYYVEHAVDQVGQVQQCSQAEALWH
jgi:hypothetical protein